MTASSHTNSTLTAVGALLAMAWVASGCSTASITLQSSPSKASIFVTPLGKGTPRLVGETPLTLKSAELLKENGGSGPVIVEYRKEGHYPSRAIVSDLSAADLTIYLDLEPLSGLEDQEKLNAVIDNVFEAQRLARAGRHEDALARLKVVEREVPRLAATYEIQGGIYYIQRKYKESLDAYAQASRYNPKNIESVRMRNFLQSRFGATESRQPASGPLVPEGRKP